MTVHCGKSMWSRNQLSSVCGLFNFSLTSTGVSNTITIVQIKLATLVSDHHNAISSRVILLPGCAKPMLPEILGGATNCGIMVYYYALWCIMVNTSLLLTVASS